MKKDAYYFSHDSNARNDFKILKLRQSFGIEGYGIFFCIIEMLREQSKHRLSMAMAGLIAYELRVDEAKILSIIKDFDLFQIDGEEFFSDRLNNSMETYNQLREKMSEGGRKGGLKRAKAWLKPGVGIKEKEINKRKEKDNTNSFAKNGKKQPDEVPDYTDTTKWAKNLIGEGYSRLLTPEERKKAELEWENKNK